MQRSTLAFGTATIAGALLLAACGGGGGSSSTTRSGLPSVTPTGAPSSSPVSPTGKTTKLTFTINRKPHTAKLPWAMSAKATATKRTPKYISYAANGMRIVITAGAQTSTLYADLANGPYNPLCAEGTAANNYSETCTIAIPMLAASESIAVTEVDQDPQNITNGYGTGFATNANVLAVGSATATAASVGTTGVTLIGLSPVIGGLMSEDAGPFNAFVAQDGLAGRIVVAAGQPQLDIAAVVFYDEDGYSDDGDQTPLSFADINGTAVAPTVEALDGSGAPTQHVLVYPYRNVNFENDPYIYAQVNGTPVVPPTGGLVQSAPMPTDDYLWEGSEFITAFSYDGSTPPAATPYYQIGVANNLTVSPASVGFSASNGGDPYTTSSFMMIAPMSQAIASTSLTVNSVSQTTVTDYGSVDGIAAAPCEDANGNVGVAAIAPNPAYDPTSGTESFAIVPVAAGSCTFNFSDGDTGLPLPAVTLTVAAAPTSPIAASPSSVSLGASGAPATVSVTESGYGGTFSPILTCQDTSPSPTGTVPALASSAAATSFTIDAGSDSAVCALLLSDTSGHILTVPVLESALDAGLTSKHRKSK
jgi:hypothetical protein